MARVDYGGRMATVYERGRALSEEVLGEWAAAIAPHVDPAAVPVVLDLGAGTGRFLPVLARFADLVVAVESAEAMLRQAPTAAALPAVRHLVGTAEAVPLRHRAVQLAWLSQVLHHVDDLDAVAGELSRLLVPGGRVLIRGAFGDSDDEVSLYRYFPGARRVGAGLPDLDRVLAAFERAGFRREVRHQIRQTVARRLEEWLERLRWRADSVLAMLDDEEFEAGLSLVQADIDAGKGGSEVVKTLDLVVLRSAGG